MPCDTARRTLLVSRTICAQRTDILPRSFLLPFSPSSSLSLSLSLPGSLSALQYVRHIVIYEPANAWVAAGNDDIKCSDWRSALPFSRSQAWRTRPSPPSPSCRYHHTPAVASRAQRRGARDRIIRHACARLSLNDLPVPRSRERETNLRPKREFGVR